MLWSDLEVGDVLKFTDKYNEYLKDVYNNKEYLDIYRDFLTVSAKEASNNNDEYIILWFNEWDWGSIEIENISGQDINGTYKGNCFEIVKLRDE